MAHVHDPTPRRAPLAAAALLAALAAGCTRGWLAMSERPAFPAEVAGWHAAGERRGFDRGTVFDYMDGAGELYLAYGFRRIVVQEYARPGGPRIVAEVYEMATSEDAWGVFSHDPEGEDVGVGQANAYAAGLLRVWQGDRFCRILAERDTPAAKAAVVALARALTGPVADGPRPDLLRRLPAESLDAASVRYFHTQVSLNSLYYLADANLLGLSPHTDAVLAAYRPGGGKLLLLVVRYGEAGQARRAWETFNRVYLKDKPPAAGPRRVEAIEEGRHVGGLVREKFLVLVFEARSRAACERLLAAAASQL